MKFSGTVNKFVAALGDEISESSLKIYNVPVC